MISTIAIILTLAYAIPFVGGNIIYWLIIDRKIIYDESAKNGFNSRSYVDDAMILFMATPIFNIKIFAGLIKRLFIMKRLLAVGVGLGITILPLLIGYHLSFYLNDDDKGSFFWVWVLGFAVCILLIAIALIGYLCYLPFKKD